MKKITIIFVSMFFLLVVSILYKGVSSEKLSFPDIVHRNGDDFIPPPFSPNYIDEIIY